MHQQNILHILYIFWIVASCKTLNYTKYIPRTISTFCCPVQQKTRVWFTASLKIDCIVGNTDGRFSNQSINSKLKSRRLQWNMQLTRSYNIYFSDIWYGNVCITYFYGYKYLTKVCSSQTSNLLCPCHSTRRGGVAVRSRLITLGGKPLDLIIYIIINKTCAASGPHKTHERPFRAAKDLL